LNSCRQRESIRAPPFFFLFCLLKFVITPPDPHENRQDDPAVRNLDPPNEIPHDWKQDTDTALSRAVSSAIERAIISAVNQQIKPAITSQVNAAVNQQIAPAIKSQVDAAVKDAINSAIETQIKPAITAQVNAAVKSSVEDLTKAMDTVVNKTLPHLAKALDTVVNITLPEIRGVIEALRQTVDANHAYVTGSNATEIAKRTSVRVGVSPPTTDHNNSYGSGNYVRAGPRHYASTNGHVVAKCNDASLTFSECPKDQVSRRNITSLELVDGTRLRQSGPALWWQKWDLALIPVDTVPGLDGAEIAEVEPNVSMHVHGYSHREGGDVYVHGKILERRSEGRFESNCEATHGFSGTGQFDGAGRLFAILSGTVSMHHLGEVSPRNSRPRDMMGSVIEYDWQKAKDGCVLSWLWTEEAFENVSLSKIRYCEKSFNALRDAVEGAAHTPRSTLRPAFHLLTLAQNSSIDDGFGVA
jgi:hypothetical protein